MRPLCSRRARRGHCLCIQSLTGPEEPQRSRGEEGTLPALSRGGRKELRQESRERSPSLGELELEKRPATLAPAVTDLSFPAWRWQETTSCRCQGSQRSTARAGASARREEKRSKRRPSSSHGAAAWGPRGATRPPSSLRHITAQGESPRCRHPTPLLAAGDNRGCHWTGAGHRAGRRLLPAALLLLTARAAARFLADRSADGSKDSCKG